MPCPFLSRLSANYVRNYGASLIMNYRQHCPVMSRLSSSMSDHAAAPTIESSANDSYAIPDPSANKCPFLSKERHTIKEASLAVKEDIINLTDDPKDNDFFQYDRHFHEKIVQKKIDHSYRYAI